MPPSAAWALVQLMGSIGRVKLGQPVPGSNLWDEANSGSGHDVHVNAGFVVVEISHSPGIRSRPAA